MNSAYAPKKATARESLVQHLVDCMEQEGLVVEAARLPGHKRPGAVKRGFVRSGPRPDAVGRDGRRAILGVAVSDRELADSEFPVHLEALAGKCRTLLVCLPDASADEVVNTVIRKGQVPSWRKLRLLRHPSTKWAEVPREATRVRGAGPQVRLRDEGRL